MYVMMSCFCSVLSALDVSLVSCGPGVVSLYSSCSVLVRCVMCVRVCARQAAKCCGGMVSLLQLE